MGKYFKYAIGEILLVVLGILIALQINNWNQNRKDRRQEIILLAQILSDFESNLEQLDQKIAMRNDFMQASRKLLEYVDEPILRNKDSIDHYIAKTIPYASFDPIMVDLNASGQLAYLKNNALKQALNRWTSDIKDVIEDEENWKFYRNNSYIPFLIQHYQLRTVRNAAYKSNVLGTYTIERQKAVSNYVNHDIGNSKHPEDYNGLLDNPDFEDHITRCYAIHSFTNMQSQLLRERLIRIIKLINGELND